MLNSYLRTLKSQLQNPKIYSLVSFAHFPSSQNRSVHNSAIQFVLNEAKDVQSSTTLRNYPVRKDGEEEVSPQQRQPVLTSTQISHPWREWVDLMEKLLKNGYFDEIGNPFTNKRELANKEANLIRTACLNFARDQYQLIRYLSREDIMVIAGSGCPSTDRKVVNSGKRLRAHVGMNEGNVCSTCILRGDCDRAYVKAREDEGGRTVDVMRFLLTYGLDPVIGSVENKPSLNKKVKESVRTLLKEMVNIKVDEHDLEPPKPTIQDRTLSTQESVSKQKRSQIDVPLKQGDWICPSPTCNFVNFARNVKCLKCDGLFPERLKQLSEEQEHLPLKKGDWICDKCNFLNFARNTRCRLCKENPPKRQLHPGEWECESCNYINFKRNQLCLKCDHRRPIASKTADMASKPANSNCVEDHHTQPWHEQAKSSRYKSENEDQIESSSWNQAPPGFKDFPVAGGKSDLSRDVQKRELWKMEMAAKSRRVIHRREDSGRHNSYIFGETRKQHAADDDDDDDDMAEWFGKGQSS